MLNRQNPITPSDVGDFSAADTIAETLQHYHLTQVDFAKRIGISEKHLSQILHRKAFISPTVALSIETVTGIPAHLLLGLDTEYRLAHTPRPTQQDSNRKPDYLKPYSWA